MTSEGEMLPVTARDVEPTVDAISEYLCNTDPAAHAIVLADASMATEGTRLASRFPTLRVYAASAASTSLDLSVVG
ncbi:hypothetical protein C6A85_26810, partial [Mycobacterium sp. ITM-2017-0098]